MKQVVRAIITNKEDRVLLIKRARGVGAGLYALVGGKPEPDENPKDAVIREVKEEIGLDFTPTGQSESLDKSHDLVNPWRVYYFTGTTRGELNLNKEEVLEVIFVSEEDISKINFAFDCKEKLYEYFRSANRF
ncbi:MAG: NUDIX hydrolase [Patescibacteria group bacterium]